MIRTRKSRLARFIAIVSLTAHRQVAWLGPSSRSLLLRTSRGYTPAPLSTTSSTSNVAGGEAQHFVEGQRYSRRVVDIVSLEAAQRFD